MEIEPPVAVAPRLAQFVVWRQDDNGNRAEVARTTCRGDANALARELAARGHKQTYWVEPA